MRSDGRGRFHPIPSFLLGLFGRTVHHHKRCAAVCELEIVIGRDLFRSYKSGELLHYEVPEPRLLLLKLDEVASFGRNHVFLGKSRISQLLTDLLRNVQAWEYCYQAMQRIKKIQKPCGFL